MYATTPGASIVIWSLVVSGLSSKTLGVMDSQDGPEQISASFLLLVLSLCSSMFPPGVSPIRMGMSWVDEEEMETRDTSCS